MPTYGIMSSVDKMQIRAYIDCLVEQGYLYLDGTDYPVLRTTQRAKQVLFHGEPVTYVCRKQDKAAEAVKERGGAPVDNGLLDALRAVRTRLAAIRGVPAYVVFSNAVLADMAARQPATMEEFMEISGVGAVKAKRYGEAFLKAIYDWKNGGHGEEVEHPHNTDEEFPLDGG